MRHSRIFARNALCVVARAGVPLNEEHMLETLLDPSLRLGTSTPQADALGDYTWAVFKKAEAARPGAFQILDAKALKLVGGELNPTKWLSAVDLLGEHGQADLFIGYCTSAAATLNAVPGSISKELPSALTVPVELLSRQKYRQHWDG
jgi:ABC-type molybdate transport system substrate-binding protein